jgi:polyisoprenoid-binding protein YceI
VRRRDVVLLGGASLLTLTASQARWTFDRAASSIELTVSAFGQMRRGRFSEWNGDIVFDPASLGQTQATVVVQSASLRLSPSTGSGYATGPSFLDAARHPTIRFRLLSVQPMGGDRYDARAEVTIKGRTNTVTFPVDLRATGERAHLTGAFSVNRADYGIGTSAPWNRLVGRQVTVRFALQARRT